MSQVQNILKLRLDSKRTYNHNQDYLISDSSSNRQSELKTSNVKFHPLFRIEAKQSSPPSGRQTDKRSHGVASLLFVRFFRR